MKASKVSIEQIKKHLNQKLNAAEFENFIQRYGKDHSDFLYDLHNLNTKMDQVHHLIKEEITEKVINYFDLS